MKSMLLTTAMVSTVALFAFAVGNTAGAGQSSDPTDCAYGQDNCDQGIQNPDEGQGYVKKHRKVDQNTNQDSGDQGNVRMGQDQGNSHWKFNPNTQERHRHKDSRFRFEFDGFWYPEPYWSGTYGYGVSSRLSCGEGRDIVSERGFYRVRPIECVGRAYTYLGRRHGETFQIIVSSRSGRVINIDHM